MQSKDHLHFALISPASNTVSAHHDICQYSLFTVTKGTGGIAEWARTACLCLKFSADLLTAMHLLPRIRPSVTVLILLCTQEDHHCLLVTRHTCAGTTHRFGTQRSAQSAWVPQTSPWTTTAALWLVLPAPTKDSTHGSAREDDHTTQAGNSTFRCTALRLFGGWLGAVWQHIFL